jgi:Clostripain family
MPTKKPWTVMVYLAADNNLSNFAVDSLRQMKAASRDNINVVAELDSGPLNRSKRYRFDGKVPFGSIEENVVKRSGPTNAADPANLADFIQWGAQEYPAERYFVTIWGHGGGIDDDFPRAPDASFVPRHQLLRLSKGTLDNNRKGTIDDNLKGTIDDNLKGTIDDNLKGLLSNRLQEIFNGPFKELAAVFKKEEDAVHAAVLNSIGTVVLHALNPQVLSEIQKAGLNGAGKAAIDNLGGERLELLRSGIIKTLKADALNALSDGALGSLRQSVLGALRRGIVQALQTGSLYGLQKAVLKALEKQDTNKAVEEIHDVVGKAILHFFETGIVQGLRQGLSDISQNRPMPSEKSVAFVDHPMSYLTNTDLQSALNLASARIGQKIDILGMDSCNMNMIEIGYELHDWVNIMVASQDEIPDASWPYDALLDHLGQNPDMAAKDLACVAAKTYLASYKDYSDKPAVTLSVLNLERCGTIVPFTRELVQNLELASRSLVGQQAIANVRTRVKCFGANEFVDLLHLCQLFSGVSSNLGLARAADDLIAPLKSLILENQVSSDEKDCNGTSIYFPEFDSKQKDHQERLGRLYNGLDFSRVTEWGSFVSALLKQQRDETAATELINSTRAAANSSDKGKGNDDHNKIEHNP